MVSAPVTIEGWFTDPWGLQDPSGSFQGLLYFHNNSKMPFAFFHSVISCTNGAKAIVGKTTGAKQTNKNNSWVLSPYQDRNTKLYGFLLHYQNNNQYCLHKNALSGIERLLILLTTRDWCWSWNSNTLATWCEELTHLKRPWCWERLKAGEEGDDSGWDGWMASPTQWTWVWVNSGSWRRTGKPGVLKSMGWQIVGHDWETELNTNSWVCIFLKHFCCTKASGFPEEKHLCDCHDCC